jgi:hypothetical protein
MRQVFFRLQATGFRFQVYVYEPGISDDTTFAPEAAPGTNLMPET